MTKPNRLNELAGFWRVSSVLPAYHHHVGTSVKSYVNFLAIVLLLVKGAKMPKTQDFISRTEAILERSLSQVELDEFRENFRAALSGRRVEESSQNLTFSLDKDDDPS